MSKNQKREPRERLRAMGMLLAIVALCCAAMFALPAREADALESLPVVIRRVMTSNPSACYNIRGKYYDWIELENTDEQPQSLKGWKLTDSGDLRDAYVFGDVTLAPGGSIVVFCADRPEDYDGDAVFTGFRLSSDGEVLLLSDPREHISALNVPPMGKACVYQRDPDTGGYAVLPFYQAMGTEAEYARTLTPDYNPNGVMISEIMPVNRTVLTDADGDFSDWIELYNPSSVSVNLKGCALSDSDVDRAKWVFGDAVMQPGAYLVVFASGKDRKDASGELHTNFKLSGKGEAVRLFNPNGDAISYMQYPSASADKSFSRQADGTVTAHLDPSPGYENTALGAHNAMVRRVKNDTKLYINEIYLAGKGTDWVELYNAGDETLDLSGMGLSDNAAKPRKWRFPEGASAAPGQYVLIEFAGSAEKQAERAAKEAAKAAKSGDDGDAVVIRPDYRVDFGLSASETVTLAAANGALMDRVELYDRHPNVSIGRAEGHDKYRYFAEVTPGAPNAEKSYAKVCRDITFNVPPGVVHQKHVNLEIYSDADANIYYTTDGSEPTAKSKVYRGPISVDSNICVRAIAAGDDMLPSQPITASFILASHSLRVVCITGSSDRLAVLKSGKKKAAGSEVYVEMYEPDGTKLVGQKCTLKMVGHHSRTHYAQKSFKLTAKRANGDTRFRAALFSNRDYDEYKSVVLRAGGQDVTQTKMRDSILTSLAEGTGVFYQETEPCVVYANGKYWGLYNLREHVDAHSICQFEGWSDPDGVNIIEGSGARAYASTGKSAGFKELLSWVKSHDLSSDSNVEKLETMMDIDNYLAFAAIQIYICNQDLNNVRCYNSAEDPRWKWALFDVDLSYQINCNNVTDWLSGSAGTITKQDTTLFRYLMRNARVRDRFLTRFGELLATNLSTANVVSKIQNRVTLISSEMTANCKRWKWDTKTWESYVRKMATYASERPAKLIGYLTDSFKLSDADVQRYFGDALAAING